MRRREGKGPPPADLLVCFPTRPHLTLKPKPICSSAWTSEPATQQNHHTRRSRGSTASGGGHASPVLWAKTRPNNTDMISEPTSPKVNCAGQIIVRPKPRSCRNWQSVMEEIERLHKKKKSRPAWIEALGFKKDVMQFLTCLRNIRFDLNCFGSFPVISDDEDCDDDDEDEDVNYKETARTRESDDNENSSDVFSKWFMILQENNKSKEFITSSDDDGGVGGPCAPPPPNALLLMRCRSAPAKSWLEEREEEEEEEEEESEGEDDEGKGKEKAEEDEKQRKTEEAERLIVMRCGSTDFSKFSSDIAKETWVVGGIKDVISRNRSSKR